MKIGEAYLLNGEILEIESIEPFVVIVNYYENGEVSKKTMFIEDLEKGELLPF